MRQQYGDIEEYDRPRGSLPVVNELGNNPNIMGRREKEPDEYKKAYQHAQPVKPMMHYKSFRHPRQKISSEALSGAYSSHRRRFLQERDERHSEINF